MSLEKEPSPWSKEYPATPESTEAVMAKNAYNEIQTQLQAWLEQQGAEAKISAMPDSTSCIPLNIETETLAAKVDELATQANELLERNNISNHFITVHGTNDEFIEWKLTKI